MRKTTAKLGFRALLLTQFLGAFNDNAFKLVISLFAVNVLVGETGGTEYVSLAGVVFVLPYLLFSTYAGFLADRFSKQKIIIVTKAAEFIIMFLGFVALFTGSIWGMYAVLFCMAVQSTFFSPAKYGILPEILNDEDLSEGNGMIHSWTYMAILLGMIFGIGMLALFKDNVYKTSLIFMGISAVGVFTSLFVSKVRPSGSRRKVRLNFLSEIVRNTLKIKKERAIFLSICALVYFNLVAGLFQLNILLYAKKVMGLGDIHTGVLVMLVMLGMGVGSFLAGRLSEHKIEFGLVPMGAIGLSIFSVMLGFTYPSFIITTVVFFSLGVSSGFYIVPLHALIQKRSPKEERGQVLATMNFLAFSAILLASGLLYFFRQIVGLNAAGIFTVMGFVSIGATFCIVRVLPESLARFINWIMIHTVYRIKVIGKENVPKVGGALLICNHVSYADAVLLLASVQRPIRFIMLRTIYDNPILKPFTRATKAIPISFRDGPKAIVKSLHQAKKAVQDGDLVCIFAEGSLTRTGNMLPFKKGFEAIVKDLDVPIIPINIDRIWGSIFSYEDEKYFWKMPRKLPYPITMSFGKPMSSSSQAHEVRTKVQELSAEAIRYRGSSQKKLHMAFIDEAKKHPFKFCMADSMGVKLSYGKTLAGILALSRKLFENKEEKEMVGVLLPSSCIAAMVNGAILISGRIPVNLNFTAPRESIEYAVGECNMKRIITSKLFLKKLKLPELKNMVYAEDIKKEMSKVLKIKSFMASILLPSFLIKALYVKGDRVNIDDVATVIFSSGSTGRPKGVMLSHRNIFSNIEGMYQVLDIKPKDVVMGVLPFFHSFGFTGTLCFPPGVGIGVVYHSNPLDASTVGKLVQKYKATILMGTPTFLSAYVRKCAKEEFKTLRFTMAGAEKLKRTIGEAFYNKFNVIPMEGYGATELSPAVSMGIPDFVSETDSERQVGYKEGKVGHPLPGVAVKIVDPDTFNMLSTDEEGLLLVKGPNVMKGYLNDLEKTKEVIKDGWYVTGDIATVDKDGFLCITDRLSRFSKIAGEMVPHIKIEETILNILDTAEPVCAVTSLADEKRGERLVVLYKGDINIEELWKKLNETSLPKLWIPREKSFYKVEDIPLLGSGKFDLKKIKVMAQEIAKEKEARNDEVS